MQTESTTRVGVEPGGNYRWITIAIAVLFNLLFEYSVRGFDHLLQAPVLTLVLLAIYFSYFTLLEDLIVRWRLGDIQVLAAGILVGTIIVPVAAGAALYPPLILGINWGQLFFINIIWWGPLQFVLAMYLANRIAPRDWNHPQLGRGGWTFFILLFGMALTTIFVAKPVAPENTLLGWTVIVLLLILTGSVFWCLTPKRQGPHLASPTGKTITFLIAGFILIVAAIIISLGIYSGDSLFQANSIAGITTLVGCLALSYLITRQALRPVPLVEAAQQFRPRLFLDVLAVASCLVFIYVGAFLGDTQVKDVGYRLNQTALDFDVYWTSILAIFMLGYRLISKTPVPV
jgi:hypothetical protein